MGQLHLAQWAPQETGAQSPREGRTDHQPPLISSEAQPGTPPPQGSPHPIPLIKEGHPSPAPLLSEGPPDYFHWKGLLPEPPYHAREGLQGWPSSTASGADMPRHKPQRGEPPPGSGPTGDVAPQLPRVLSGTHGILSSLWTEAQSQPNMSQAEAQTL